MEAILEFLSEPTLLWLSTLAAVNTLFFFGLDALLSVMPSGIPGVDMGHRRQRLYVLSTLHAVVVSGFAAYKLLVSGTTNIWGIRELGSWTLGYFLHDFFCTAPDWMTHHTEFYHHALAIGVTIAGLSTEAIAQFNPGFVVVEGSTVLYNITWFMKKAGHGSHHMHDKILMAFTAAFFLLRCCWLPYHAYDMVVMHPEVWDALPFPKYGVYGLLMLQFYWMFMIAKKALSVMGGSSSAAEPTSPRKKPQPQAGSTPKQLDSSAAASDANAKKDK